MKKILRRIIIILILISMGLEIILPFNYILATNEEITYDYFYDQYYGYYDEHLEEIPEGYNVFVPNEDGGYIFYTPLPSTGTNEGGSNMNDGSTHPQFIKNFLSNIDNVYYIDENGEKRCPEYEEVTPPTEEGYIIKLKAGVPYYYTSEIVGQATSSDKHVYVVRADSNFLNDMASRKDIPTPDADAYAWDPYKGKTTWYNILTGFKWLLDGNSNMFHLTDYTGNQSFLLQNADATKAKFETGWYIIQQNVILSENMYNTAKSIYYYDSNGKVHFPTYKRLIDEDGQPFYIIYLVSNKIYYRDSNVGNAIKYDPTEVSALEKALSKFVYALANGVHYLIGVAMGRAVTIDDLVFNKYPETNISYFDTKEEAGEMASSLVYGTNGVGGLDSVVNAWYDIFMKIALLAYMAFLVYMGIRIMFTSTSEQKAGYKQLFVDWVIGLAILLLFPYAMKYMIKMNEGFVKMIVSNEQYVMNASSVVETMEYDDDLSAISIDHEIDWSTGGDYMSTIALAADETCRLALSVAFMIMTWQLIALLVHYYKRLFMVAFLIVIFPLVGLWYAIDKIADGKTQAFNTWLKEFILNVFSQSFHALVYMFCCATIYSSGTDQNYLGFDYILIIVGVTFILKGEEIIRQIFGQVSEAGTMKSLSQSAVGTFAKFKLAEGAVRFVGENTVGRKSLVNKLYRGTNKLRAVNAKRRAFDKASKTPQEFNDGMRLEHAPTPPSKNASEAEKNQFIKDRDLFNSAAILNNPKSHSYAEKAMAFEKLRNQALKDPNHDVFKDTKMTAGQIIAMGDVTKDIQNGIASGKNRVQIERDVTARLGIIFYGESEEKIKEKEKTLYTLLDIKGANDTVKKGDVRREINSIIREAEDIRDGLYYTDDKDKKDEIATDVMSEAFDIYDSYEYSTREEQEQARDYAVNVAILKYRNSGYYTERDILEAAKYVKEHAEDSDITREMAEKDLDMDRDMFMHVLARNVLKTSTNEENKVIAQEIVDDYEKDSRDGYFDDQVSLHEVVMKMEDTSALDLMIEEVYQNKKDAMTEMTQELGQEYLVDNRVDILENHYDTTTRTLDGLTKEEIEASAIKETSKMIRDILAVNKENATHETDGIIDWWMREYIARSKEERTGIRRSRKEEADVLDVTISGQDYIDKNKKERERIQGEHFEGDIGDRKE